MSESLKRIRLLFGSYLIATVLRTVSVFGLCLLWAEHEQRTTFYENMPATVRAEFEQLRASGQEKGARVNDIYEQYWPGDEPGISGALLAALVISLLIGLIFVFLTARAFVRPIASVAEAAQRISKGDFTIRAALPSHSRALADLVQSFNAMADSLEHHEAYRKEMLAAISHELRTPLTILRGRLHAICDGVIPGSDEEHHRLLGQTEHLVRLVDDLNTLALAEAGQLSLHRVRTDLGAFIHELVPLYSERAAAHNVSMGVDIVPAPVPVLVDRSRLQQVLANLIENALRYAAGGGVLLIRVREEEGRAILELKDRGPGLPPDVIRRVFEPFFRVDNSRSRATGGSGLGLAVVRMLISMHGGEVWAGNRRSGGAVFRISLPRA